MIYNAKTDRTKRILVHYFRTAFQAAGLSWDSDNTAEVESVVDDILDATKP